MIQIDKKIIELTHFALKETIPSPDVSGLVMDTLRNTENTNGGIPLRLWFMAASMAASFIMMLMAYKMYSSNVLLDMVDIVSWAV